MTEEKYRKIKVILFIIGISIITILGILNIINDSNRIYKIDETEVLRVNKITNKVEVLKTEEIKEEIDIEANKKNIRKVYDRLSNELKDMPSFNKFCEDVQDENKCNKIYDFLSKDTLISMPTREVFINKMTLKQKD